MNAPRDFSRLKPFPDPDQPENDLADAPGADEGRDTIWKFFESSCAYCGRKLNRSQREGHMDHVIAATAGGVEDATNFVLACGTCNSDEKREMDWEKFLATREPEPKVWRDREAKIRAWMASQQRRRT